MRRYGTGIKLLYMKLKTFLSLGCGETLQGHFGNLPLGVHLKKSCAQLEVTLLEKSARHR